MDMLEMDRLSPVIPFYQIYQVQSVSGLQKVHLREIVSNQILKNQVKIDLKLSGFNDLKGR